MPARNIAKMLDPSAYGSKVLICDDDEDYIEECSEALTRMGFTVGVGRGPRLFRQSLKDFEPDILLLDMFMPDFDGMEVLHILRDYERKDMLAVVIVSGAQDPVLSSAETLAKAYGIRLLGIVPKPVALRRLTEILT